MDGVMSVHCLFGRFVHVTVSVCLFWCCVCPSKSILCYFLIFLLTQYLFYILKFMLQSVTLTKHDKKRLVWIMNPEVLQVIATRALFAKAFLLPVMKKGNQFGMFSLLLGD